MYFYRLQHRHALTSRYSMLVIYSIYKSITLHSQLTLVYDRSATQDLLQADEITIELLSLRSFGPDLIGERIYFQLRFFQFPAVRTVAATLSGKAGEACLLRSAVTNERLAVVYSGLERWRRGTFLGFWWDDRRFTYIQYALFMYTFVIF